MLVETTSARLVEGLGYGEMARDESLFDIVVGVARDVRRFASSQSVW